MSAYEPNISERVLAEKAQIEQMTEAYNESTGASWLWALLLGPIYYAYFGFWGRAVIIFLLNVILIGIIISPLIVYPAWKSRARMKAEQTVAIDKVRVTHR